MDIHIIVAMTKDRVIGIDDTLPWRISEDSKIFKQTTLNKIVIMGKKTWFSLPERLRPLPERTNIVIGNISVEEQKCFTFKTADEAIREAERLGNEVYIIGGAKVYETFIPLADYLHISWVKKDYKGDTYFPEIDFNQWVEISSKDYNEFTHKVYKKIY